LGQWSFLSIIALTSNHLTATNWTTFNIATEDVKLRLQNSTVMARLTISTPIIRLIAIANALPLDAANNHRWLQLSSLNLLRPSLSSTLLRILVANSARAG